MDDHHRMPCRLRAFTMVELLAVLLLLSLVVGLGAQGLASSHSAAKYREAMAVVHDFDRHARIVARTHGPVQLVVTENGQSLALLDRRTREGILVARMPDGVKAIIETTDESRTIVFERTGRTVDYEVALRADGLSTQWRISGLTGQVLTQSRAGP